MTAQPLTPEGFVASLQHGLLAQADTANAAAMAAYMRDQFAFLGVKSAERRAVTTPLIRAARSSFTATDYLHAARQLWALPEREYQIAAVDLLADRPARLGSEALPVLDELIGSKAWWDSVDGLAANVVGPLVQILPGLLPVMDDWAAGERLWHKRTAILHQLGYKTATDTARLFGYCRDNAGHPDFFIRKAIGWALRQYARTDADAVGGFLAREGERLSPLSLREAAKHL
ncbi:3-methyladenine DNA glycosylase AlkD [Andreprevotia lacus DSM 23236]|jgi:3-methyladenine DNA glycosylase AlkD|uniref:3-methyladenine DNA glycosylase AlkD n=1 Tax=Andreprevotia lacus DSM 23236 TaxID=1121001 RepID=A0A1W1XUA7_9NEIS|nr:DNA alkylation repair protein [Andreprevotia lacus]SMC27477.1 3-methyladenine DNA glycosylase AlkD [Andreprevotia lacus DSM 23236]